MARYQVDNLIVVVSTMAVLLVAAGVFLGIVRRRMSERQEVRRALIEKLSPEELIRLAGTDGGRAWLRDMFGSATDTRAELLRQAMQMIFGGAGCGVVASLMRMKPIGIAGIILIAVGLGQLVAAALLARRERTSDEQ
jgi:hypothetical protein